MPILNKKGRHDVTMDHLNGDDLIEEVKDLIERKINELKKKLKRGICYLYYSICSPTPLGNGSLVFECLNALTGYRYRASDIKRIIWLRTVLIGHIT